VNTTSIYCQSCRSANDLSETHCRECGTRLLLVIFPNSLQYDTNHVPTYYEDHLLERVTLLELRLSKLTGRLESALELLQRGLDAFQKDHVLLQSFLDAVKRSNPEFIAEFAKSIKAKSDKQNNKSSATDKKNKTLTEILREHKNPNAELFTHLINEGVHLLADSDEKTAFQMLERAALLSPTNKPLRIFIAENLFRADKYAEAKKHLENIVESAPTESKIVLLLGAISADFGETEKSRRLLSALANDAKTSQIVNYIWGMLAAFEENWLEAIAAFKEADGNAQSAELQYLIGCAYFALKRYSNALQHLQNALVLDAGFSDAWFAQSLIFKLQNDETKEKNAFEAAIEQKENGAQCNEYLKGKKMPNLEIALPFAHFKRENARVLTGGALRLTKFFRERILSVIEQENDESI
jgi:tetratricopeptide (TPR) repeat protein